MSGDSIATTEADPLVERFRALQTAAVSDALDSRSLLGSARGLAPLFDAAHVTGRAFTIRYAPVGEDAGTVGDYIDDVPPGSIVVIDNGGRTDCTVWGDILTSVASARAIGGTVVWGVCRDGSKALGVGALR